MDNFHYIKRASREELIDIINLLVDEGHHLISDEMWEATHTVDNSSVYEEVDAWLNLDTLQKNISR